MKRPRAAGIMARAGTVPFSGLLGAVLAIPLLAGPVLAQQTSARPDGELPVKAVRQDRGASGREGAADARPAEGEFAAPGSTADARPADGELTASGRAADAHPAEAELSASGCLAGTVTEANRGRDLPSPSHGSGRQK